MRQYHFVVYGTVTDQGHVEFHIDEETASANFSDGLVYNDEGDWEVISDENRDVPNYELLFKTLEKRIRS